MLTKFELLLWMVSINSFHLFMGEMFATRNSFWQNRRSNEEWQQILFSSSVSSCLSTNGSWAFRKWLSMSTSIFTPNFSFIGFLLTSLITFGLKYFLVFLICNALMSCWRNNFILWIFLMFLLNFHQFQSIKFEINFKSQNVASLVTFLPLIHSSDHGKLRIYLINYGFTALRRVNIFLSCLARIIFSCDFCCAWRLRGLEQKKL